MLRHVPVSVFSNICNFSFFLFASFRVVPFLTSCYHVINALFCSFIIVVLVRLYRFTAYIVPLYIDASIPTSVGLSRICNVRLFFARFVSFCLVVDLVLSCHTRFFRSLWWFSFICIGLWFISFLCTSMLRYSSASVFQTSVTLVFVVARPVSFCSVVDLVLPCRKHVFLVVLFRLYRFMVCIVRICVDPRRSIFPSVVFPKHLYIF